MQQTENKAPKSSATAAERFQYNMQQAKHQMQLIEMKMERLQCDWEKTDQKDWGFVGDIARLNQKLSEIIE